MIANHTLPHAALRDRLLALWDSPESADSIDLKAVLNYLTALPDTNHTPESIDALLQLTKNLWRLGDLEAAIQSCSHAARIAQQINSKGPLCQARGILGVILGDRGQYVEATLSLAECWTLARELGDIRREATAITDFGQLCGGLGQYDVAARYFERAMQVASEKNYRDLELRARANLAVCAIELRDPLRGFTALSYLDLEEHQTRQNIAISASAYHNLAHLHLLAGNLPAAREHAEKSAELFRTAQFEQGKQLTRAMLGLIAVHSGSVEEGLIELNGALAAAKRSHHTEILGLFRMCADAYEVAGQPDLALDYLQQLIEWKKALIGVQITQLQDVELEPSISQIGPTVFEKDVAAATSLLQAGVEARILRLIEMSINAEISCGHSMYRIFRVSQLARCLAAELGWKTERISSLSLAAKLCNIGMLAIPHGILKLGHDRSLTIDRDISREHTRLGAELLRRSGIKRLELASVVAEQHHERFDGSGYPRGLYGESIIEEARIVAVCELFEAKVLGPASRSEAASLLSNNDFTQRLGTDVGTGLDPVYVHALSDWFKRNAQNSRRIEILSKEEAEKFEYVRARARIETLSGSIKIEQRTPAVRASRFAQ